MHLAKRNNTGGGRLRKFAYTFATVRNAQELKLKLNLQTMLQMMLGQLHTPWRYFMDG